MLLPEVPFVKRLAARWGISATVARVASRVATSAGEEIIARLARLIGPRGARTTLGSALLA